MGRNRWEGYMCAGSVGQDTQDLDGLFRAWGFHVCHLRIIRLESFTSLPTLHPRPPLLYIHVHLFVVLTPLSILARQSNCGRCNRNRQDLANRARGGRGRFASCHVLRWRLRRSVLLLPPPCGKVGSPWWSPIRSALLGDRAAWICATTFPVVAPTSGYRRVRLRRLRAVACASYAGPRWWPSKARGRISERTPHQQMTAFLPRSEQ